MSAETVSDNDGNERVKYSYLEAYCSKEEFEQFKLTCQMQNKDVTAAQIEYDYKLDTPIVYKETGFTYKPKWAETIYIDLIEKGTKFTSIFPMLIYDSTKQKERAVKMTLQELIALTMFLAEKQQQYFREKKEAEIEE